MSPAQVGVPNQRTRYFLLAKRGAQLPQVLPSSLARADLLEASELDEVWRKGQPLSRPTGEVALDVQSNCRPLSEYLEPPDTAELVELAVPEHVLERYGSTMDLVGRKSRRSCCFTKNYSRYYKGTGSVVCEAAPDGEPTMIADKSLATLQPLRPRFFAPREIARIHGFPECFHFPSAVGRKKQYELLGNSLSVQVVTALLKYLLGPPNPAGSTPVDGSSRSAHEAKGPCQTALVSLSAEEVERYFRDALGDDEWAGMQSRTIAELERLQADADNIATAGRDDEAQCIGLWWSTKISTFIA